jgi:signal transduction histidine kinase
VPKKLSSSSDDRIRREARVVGLRGFSTPSLEAVERRRLQLWILSAMLLVSVAVGVAFLSMWPTAPHSWLVRPTVLRLAIVCLSVAFSAYAIEKEMHLRRLARLLVDERVLTAALTNRLHEVSLLLEAGKSINAALELSVVLETILRSAVELLTGTSGSIMLAEGDELIAACVEGNSEAEGARVRFGEGIAGHVAVSREPLLIDGRADPKEFPGVHERKAAVDSALCVPLVNREELLGVLNVNAQPGRLFTEYELRALNLFAEQAAVAIANARMYESERAHVAQLLQLDRLKSDFVALVSHELRTPITSIIAAAATARRIGIEPQQEELAGIIERQGKRLHAMVEDLLSEAKLEDEQTLPRHELVDVGALARLAATDFSVADRPVEVDAADGVNTFVDPESLRRVLDNLLMNAFKYGEPPVRIVVTADGNRVLLSVEDHGPGIPESEREAIFERFHRIDRDRGAPGLGLGLSIVRGLVKAAHGDIWIDDTEGGGTAVRVWMPAAQPGRKAV